jgi:hypothetical protein
MARYKALSLKEVADIVSDPSFLNNNEDYDDFLIDIVEIPPNRVDEVSDNENIDDNLMNDYEPEDVLGHVEIHTATLENNFTPP